ncbi:MAG TPA: pilus (MSHA type) biogenesis protein MshL [Gammaproteobacteria bacterium]|nr:pilus (MSHA type) biogenesis protein MshL [Gammaproteobacteria bacterium]
MWKSIVISGLVLTLASCAQFEPKPFEPSKGHIQTDKTPPAEKKEIPEVVRDVPALPEPEAPKDLEKYTVVVNEVPVKELLFALARDAEINVDIDPAIQGVVTLNAVDQTLPQILDRISRQTDIRYDFVNDNLLVQTDEPYFRTYKVNYVNMTRDTDGTVAVSSEVATTSGTGVGGEGSTQSSRGSANKSITNVESISNNRFWQTLVNNVLSILGETTTQQASTPGTIPSTENVIPNSETGVLTVRATSAQHKEIQKHLEHVLNNATRQVLIQATILEVDLSDQYQAGIDWSFLNQAAGISLTSVTGALIGPTGTLTQLLLSYNDTEIADEDSLNLTVRLLDEFGDVSVLSSPQLMVLNNQTALLKVVDNVVYFTIESNTITNQTTTDTFFTTEIHTVPVGIVMSMTPQINENDTVILNIRPSISRISRFVQDPNPDLGAVTSTVPEIQVREMDSMLRIQNGQIAVLGGLMQDETRDNINSIPGVSKLPGVGKAFETTTKEYFKTELVIFLRPVVIRDPSIDGDLQLYKTFLENRPSGKPDEVSNL